MITNLCSLILVDNASYRITLGNINYLDNIKSILFTPADIYNPVYLSLMLAFLYAVALFFTLTQINIKNKFIYWIIVTVSLLMMCGKQVFPI